MRVNFVAGEAGMRVKRNRREGREGESSRMSERVRETRDGTEKGNCHPYSKRGLTPCGLPS